MKRKAGIRLAIVAAVFVCAATAIFLYIRAGGDAVAVVSDPVFYVNPYGNGRDSADTVHPMPHKDGGRRLTLYLPADCDRSALTLYCGGGDTDVQRSLRVSGKTVQSGEKTDCFARGRRFTVKANGTRYVVRIMQSANIPAVYLQTEKDMDYVHEDKEHKTGGTVRTYENGVMTLDAALKHLKGRGNSTWNDPKKSYNIKLEDKAEMLGMAKGKKWALISSYLDPGFGKNAVAWEISAGMGIPFTTEYRFADVFINGDYYGTYIVCESVEVGENRVEITDLTKATEKANPGTDVEAFPVAATVTDGVSLTYADIPQNPKDITGGYLLECDYPHRLADEISTFVTKRGQPVVLKDPEYATKEQVTYISTYWQAFEDALYAPDGFNGDGVYYAEYADVQSFADMFILLELSENSDAGVSSTFIYKDAGGKLTAGMMWDNDSAFGNGKARGNMMTNDAARWYLANMNYNVADNMHGKEPAWTVYALLFRHEDFRALVKERWEASGDVLDAAATDMFLSDLRTELKASCAMNARRWYGPKGRFLTNGSVGLTKAFLQKRIKALSRGFGDAAAFISYDANGGRGWTIENRMAEIGDRVRAKGPYNGNRNRFKHAHDIKYRLSRLQDYIEPPEEGLVFAGWNTLPDGSGSFIRPGQKFRVEGDVTLYAQWRPAAGEEDRPYRYVVLLNNYEYDMISSVLRMLWTFISYLPRAIFQS